MRKRVRLASTGSLRRPHSPSPSSWLVDERGERGVIWQQRYVGRAGKDSYWGIARDRWNYEVGDEAVARDELGGPLIISNMGEDWLEIGAAWQAIEDAGARKNAKITIRVVAPFDSEASPDEMRMAITHFCETVLKPLGLPYSATIHEPSLAHNADDRNFHPHLSFSLKPMTRVAPYTFGISNSVRSELDGRDAIQAFRHLWVHSKTVAAEQAGRTMRYVGLSHAARRTGHEVSEHLGEARTDMVRRGGYVAAHMRNLEKEARNQARRSIRNLDRKIAALQEIQTAALAVGSHRATARSVRVYLTPGREPTVEATALTLPRSRQRTPSLAAATVANPGTFGHLLDVQARAINSPNRERPVLQLRTHDAPRPLWTTPLVTRADYGVSRVIRSLEQALPSVPRTPPFVAARQVPRTPPWQFGPMWLNNRFGRFTQGPLPRPRHSNSSAQATQTGCAKLARHSFPRTLSSNPPPSMRGLRRGWRASLRSTRDASELPVTPKRNIVPRLPPIQ